MNELIAAAQQARNALSEACGGRCNSEYNPCWYYEAAIRLEAAIEQAKRQQALDKMAENARELGLDYEPVEWLTGCPECGMDSGCDCDSGTWNPPAAQRKPLTDEQILEHFRETIDTGSLLSFADGVRFAEAAHGIKEKNGGAA